MYFLKGCKNLVRKPIFPFLWLNLLLGLVSWTREGTVSTLNPILKFTLLFQNYKITNILNRLQIITVYIQMQKKNVYTSYITLNIFHLGSKNIYSKTYWALEIPKQNHKWFKMLRKRFKTINFEKTFWNIYIFLLVFLHWAILAT